MDPTISKLLDEDIVLPVIAIGCGTLIAITGIVFTCVRAMVVSRAKESTKRELAAYVAEGTLDPEKAVAIINAGRPHWETGHKCNAKGAGERGCGCA